MKLLLIRIILLMVPGTFLFAQDFDNSQTGVIKKNTGRSNKQTKKKKNTEIDLEALDIQGLIDRPQTLYILKKSKIDFYDTIDDNDYVKSIIESTYKPPF